MSEIRTVLEWDNFRKRRNLNVRISDFYCSFIIYVVCRSLPPPSAPTRPASVRRTCGSCATLSGPQIPTSCKKVSSFLFQIGSFLGHTGILGHNVILGYQNNSNGQLRGLHKLRNANLAQI